MVGGKGMLIYDEETRLGDASNGESDRFYKFTAGMGVANIGYAFVGAKDRLRLYPQVGLGATSFLFQVKEPFPADSAVDFPLALEDDHMSMIQKMGLAVDLCLGFDWFVEFIELKALVPGLAIGPLLHAEAGYTFVPGELAWKRDTDDLKVRNDGELTPQHTPHLKFQGFYFNVGIGLGLSSPTD